MKRSLFILLTGILLLQGCSLTVNLMNPQPNLNLPETKQSIALVIEDDIKDSFTIPAQNGIRKANVSGWHTSLQNGFKNGFEDYFSISDDKSNSDLIIKLSRADIEFAPAAVSGQYGVVTVYAQITFKATLLNNSGEVFNRSSGTSVSKSATGSKVTSGVESAVESMYEILGQKFFEN